MIRLRRLCIGVADAGTSRLALSRKVDQAKGALFLAHKRCVSADRHSRHSRMRVEPSQIVKHRNKHRPREVSFGKQERLRGDAFGFCVRFLSCPTAGRDGLRRKHPMARSAATVPSDFALPAPICVCALLVACALTKGGHPYWSIGAPIFLYTLKLSGAACNDLCVFARISDAVRRGAPVP